jgi:hypothetical protein
MKEILVAGTALCCLVSCSIKKQTTSTSKSLGIYGAGVIQKPVLVHLKVNPQKITSHYSGNGSLGMDYHKSQAIAKAMIENRADVIIEEAFEITATLSKISIVVSGYAGNYENFRQLTGADTALLVDVGIINYNNGSVEVLPTSSKKKGKGLQALLGR